MSIISDEQIKAHLIQNGIVPALRFEKVWKTYQAGNKALLKLLTGTLCHVEPDGVLVFRRYPGLDELFRIPLLKPEQRLQGAAAQPDPEAPAEKPWEWAYIDSDKGTLMSEKTLPPDTPLSLLLTRQGCFLHYPGFEQDAHLGMTSVLLDHPTLAGRPRDHFDLYVSPDRHYLLASHRESGEVTLISLEQLTRLKSMQLLPKGSAKALNVAFDIVRRSSFKAYITDNASQYMYVVDLANMHASPWASGMGALGNLQLTRDRQKLFLITHQPSIGIKYLDKEQLKPLATLKTKGMSLCAQGQDPQDLMLMTQAAETPYLMLLTYMQELDGLPVVHVIDAQETKTLKRYSLKNLSAPDLLLAGMVNPVSENAGTLVQMLIEEALISESQWEAIREELESRFRAGTLAKVLSDTPVFDPGRLDEGAGSSESRAPEPLNQDPEIFDLLDVDGEPINLPLEVNEAIFRLFIWYFYQATLTNLEVHAPELYKLRKVAARTRKRLERKLAVMVTIPAILGKYTLELPISRKMVFRFLEQLRRNRAQAYQLNLCPACHAVMVPEAGCPICPECGLALDSPEEKRWRRQASTEHSGFLPPGQMLFVLRQAQRLLVMTPWQQPLFVFDSAAAGVRHLADAVVLPNLNFLITDTLAKRIGEYSTHGQLIWSSRLTLKQPIGATLYQTEEYEERFLIVDKGLRQVLEINRKSQLLRAWPEQPEGELLPEPLDVQRTPDNHWLILDAQAGVLEVDALGEIISRWGAEQQLVKAIFARRLPSGETLIVDAAEAKIQCFEGETCVRSYGYWPPATPSRFSDRPAPDKAMRQHNGEILLVGQGFYALANPQRQTLRGPFALEEAPDASKTLLKLQISASERSIDRQQQILEQSKFLQSVGLLADSTERQRMLVAEPLMSIRFAPGETIIQDLGQSGALYFIVSGSVEVVKEELKIKQLEAGEVFGEIGLVAVAASRQEFSVRARTACQVYQLERNAFKKVIMRYPRFFHLVRALANESQSLLKRYQDEKSQAMTDKLAHKLMVTKVSQHPLFSGKGALFYETLAQHLRLVAFMPNQVLYSRGESADNLYILNEGSVGITRKGEQAPGVTLAEGEIFGEMAFFSGSSRAATVTTLDYCKMFELDYADLEKLLIKQVWLKAKLEKLAQQRAEQNAGDLAVFEERMGLRRPDLPTAVTWSLSELQEDALVFAPMLGADLILGVENSGEILWCCGKEPGLKFKGVTRLQQAGGEALISDTGNDRIVRLDLQQRKITGAWQNWDKPFDQPRSGWLTADQLMLVADEGNSRLVMIDADDKQVWEFAAPHEIMNPCYAEETDKGTILFADAGLHKVYEITRAGEVIWSYGRLMIGGEGPGELMEPTYVHRLDSGETLIADTGNDRLVVVSRLGRENALFYGTSSHPLTKPRHCEVRENGDILVFSASEDKLLRLDHWGEPIWSLSLTPAAKAKETTYVGARLMISQILPMETIISAAEAEALAISDDEADAVFEADAEAMVQEPSGVEASNDSAALTAETPRADADADSELNLDTEAPATWQAILDMPGAESPGDPMAFLDDALARSEEPSESADEGPSSSISEPDAELLETSMPETPDSESLPTSPESPAPALDLEPIPAASAPLKRLVLKSRQELLAEEEDDIIEDF